MVVVGEASAKMETAAVAERKEVRASTVWFSESLVEEAKRQVIKVGDGVCFRQQSDPAVRKGRVAGTDEDGVVIEGFDLASPLHDAKCMPPRCREGTIDLFHHLRNSLHDAVQKSFCSIKLTRSR